MTAAQDSAQTFLSGLSNQMNRDQKPYEGHTAKQGAQTVYKYNIINKNANQIGYEDWGEGEGGTTFVSLDVS